MIRIAPLTTLKQSGIGLVELMISMLIGLFVMAGVVQMFSTSSQNAVVIAGASRIQENSRYVFSRVAEDIAQTGNLGCVSVSNGNLANHDFMENLLGVSSGAGQPYDFDSIVNGDQSATAMTDPGGIAIGTDTFRIRYVNHLFKVDLGQNVPENASSITLDTADPDFGRLDQYQIVALTNCTQGAVFMITNNVQEGGGLVQFATGVDSPTGQNNVRGTLVSSTAYGLVDGSSTATSPTYLYGGTTGSYQYFIGTSAAAGTNTCSQVAADNPDGTNTGPQNCALFRRHKGTNEELVEGAYNMEVFYGWTNSAGSLFFSRANGVSDWGRVDRLRVAIDFNSVDGVVVNGNAIDTSASGLITRRVERTFNLANQL